MPVIAVGRDKKMSLLCQTAIAEAIESILRSVMLSRMSEKTKIY